MTDDRFEAVDEDRLDGRDLDDDEDDAGSDFGPTFTPRQIIGGFVLLAALIALLSRRRRRREPDD